MAHLRRITTAVTNITEMVAFYNAVFGAGLEPLEMAGHTLYQGQLGGVELIFTPNALLNISAERNRQQFDITVEDAEAALDAALAHGGTLLNHAGMVGGGRRYLSLLDPDGNTIVLVAGEDT